MSALLRRLAWSVFVVWAVATLTFAISHVLPKDPARLAAGAQARPADVERVRHQLGLDLPVRAQYILFLRRLVHTGPPQATGDHATCAIVGPLHIDLGRSYLTPDGRPVSRLVLGPTTGLVLPRAR